MFRWLVSLGDNKSAILVSHTTNTLINSEVDDIRLTRFDISEN